MIRTVEEFYRIANRMIHGFVPQVEEEGDIADVLYALSDMHLKKRSDGRYRESIFKYFEKYPQMFEYYFKPKDDPYVTIGEYVVDKRELFKLKSDYIEQGEVYNYRQWMDTKYLLSDTGILYDMEYHHQLKAYWNRDGYCYYYIYVNGESKTVDTQTMINRTFHKSDSPIRKLRDEPVTITNQV